MFRVDSDFIANFKLGDNIWYNLQILTTLYYFHDDPNATEEVKGHLRKMIIVQIGSITEALLHDFHSRVKIFTIEGVAGLLDPIRDYIRSKNYDVFEHYISSARKHNLFNLKYKGYYDRLDDLRKLRNRVHIQNTKKLVPLEEIVAFTNADKLMAEKVLEVTAKGLCKYYPRSLGKKYVPDLELPWNEHFPNY